MNEKLFKRVILIAGRNYKSRVYEFTLRTGVIPQIFALSKKSYKLRWYHGSYVL